MEAHENTKEQHVEQKSARFTYKLSVKRKTSERIRSRVNLKQYTSAKWRRGKVRRGVKSNKTAQVTQSGGETHKRRKRGLKKREVIKNKRLK